MDYKVDKTKYKGDEHTRFVLSTVGTRPLYVIGLNPSTADDLTPDHTIKKVHGFATQDNYDSFVMLNLYAQRTTYPKDLHDTLDRQLHRQNLDHILTIIKASKAPSFLAGWGETIRKRDYFVICLRDIVDATKNENIKWLKIGDLTKSRHPRHPSRPAYSLGLTDFDIDAYLTTLN